MIIKAEADTSLYTLLHQIYESKVDDVTISFSKDSELYLNAVNLRVLKKLAANKGKDLKFSAENPAHKPFIQQANNGGAEFGEEEIDLESQPLEVPRKKLKLPNVFPWNKSKKRW